MTSTPPALPAPSRPAAAWVHWAFLGPDGARAGWRCLLYGLTVFGFGLIMAYIGSHLGKLPKGELAPHFLIISDGLMTWVVTLATAVMAWVEGKRLRDYGLGGPHLVRNFVSGLAGGFASLSALVGALYGAGVMGVDGMALHGIAILQSAAAMGVAFLLVALAEELLMRGYLLTTLTRGLGFWPAAALTSVLFTVAHLGNPGETALGLSAVFAAGVLFCVLVRVSGSLWLGIGFHAAWDWAQSFFYGVADSGTMLKGHLLNTHAMGAAWLSGGTTGPEGSVLDMPITLLGLLALIWVYRPRGAAVLAGTPAYS